MWLQRQQYGSLLLPLPGIVVWIKVVRDPNTEKNQKGRRGYVSLSLWQMPMGGCLCRAGVVSGVQPSPLGTYSFLWETDSAESLEVDCRPGRAHGCPTEQWLIRRLVPNVAVLESEGLPQYMHWHPVRLEANIAPYGSVLPAGPVLGYAQAAGHFTALCQTTCTAVPLS